MTIPLAILSSKITWGVLRRRDMQEVWYISLNQYLMEQWFSSHSFYALHALLSRLSASPRQRPAFLSISLRSSPPFPLWSWLSRQNTSSELWMWALHLHPVKVCCSGMRDPSNADRNRQVGGWSPHSEKRRWMAEIRNAESIVPCWKGWTGSALKSWESIWSQGDLISLRIGH